MFVHNYIFSDYKIYFFLITKYTFSLDMYSRGFFVFCQNEDSVMNLNKCTTSKRSRVSIKLLSERQYLYQLKLFRLRKRICT